MEKNENNKENEDFEEVNNSEVIKNTKETKAPKVVKDHRAIPVTDPSKIILKSIEKEMKQSYLDYSMSVIVGRALPDIRDGLKPVHRRILFAMHELGMTSNKPYKKSARIVGEVLGKFHPHGDAAVYDSLVRMAQSFSLRYPLIDGQGNFGSVDGDSPASMRYTEARMAKIAEEMLIDIEKQTVNFVPNFDGSLEEPGVLPSKFPNLLVNGSSGIAVGMATNIPTHNIGEVIDATVKLINNPQITAEEIIETIPGPDFPTGGIIMGFNNIKKAYLSGRGKIIIRAKTEIEEKNNRKSIIVTEIPYMVNKAMLIEEIADHVKNKTIEGIADLRDESDREGMRIVIKLKVDASPELVLNNLYKYSRMKETFGINMIALVNGKPKILTLLQMIRYYLQHRQYVVRKRTEFDLTKAEEKAHILEGLIIALDNIDDAIQIIKQSKSVEEATKNLQHKFPLSNKQCEAILNMRLQRLTSLQQDKIRIDHQEILKIITHLKTILADENEILKIIKEELIEMKKSYNDDRKTQIIDGEEEDIDMEDLIEDEKVVITMTTDGYVKRQPLEVFRLQKRGGKGIIAAKKKEEDLLEEMCTSNNLDYLLFFTSSGDIHWLKSYRVPEASRIGKGIPIVNLLETDKSEKIAAFTSVRDFEGGYLIMVTAKGVVKKTLLSAFANPRKGGIKAIKLDEGDQLIGVEITNGTQDIMLATSNGNAIRFKEDEVRAVGRASRGVRGIKLKKDDRVVSLVVPKLTQSILTVTENGFGKRTALEEYNQIHRGGSGVINIKTTERNGKVVLSKAVEENDEIVFISEQGIMLRTNAQNISVIGRNTQGVTIMKLEDNDKIVAASVVNAEEEQPAKDNVNDEDKTQFDDEEKDSEVYIKKETKNDIPANMKSEDEKLIYAADAEIKKEILREQKRIEEDQHSDEILEETKKEDKGIFGKLKKFIDEHLE